MAARALHRAGDDRRGLVRVKSCRLAGGADGNKSGNSGLQLPVDQRVKRRPVDAASMQ